MLEQETAESDSRRRSRRVMAVAPLIGRGLSAIGVVRWKTDPSRGGGHDRRVAVAMVETALGTALVSGPGRL